MDRYVSQQPFAGLLPDGSKLVLLLYSTNTVVGGSDLARVLPLPVPKVADYQAPPGSWCKHLFQLLGDMVHTVFLMDLYTTRACHLRHSCMGSCTDAVCQTSMLNSDNLLA
eukprot:GHRR01021726.1.p2 GENE.GHRR01021726.1~~GHRR01021726.1.p2  ORF type:complete len:111 (+),score=31.53 GHRR01021726.1:1488-1820(+)